MAGVGKAGRRPSAGGRPHTGPGPLSGAMSSCLPLVLVVVAIVVVVFLFVHRIFVTRSSCAALTDLGQGSLASFWVLCGVCVCSYVCNIVLTMLAIACALLWNIYTAMQPSPLSISRTFPNQSAKLIKH